MAHPTVDVPAWFVDNCVTTASQIKNQHIRLIIRETNLDAQEETDDISSSSKSLSSTITVVPEDDDDDTRFRNASNTPPAEKESVQPSVPIYISHEQASGSNTEEPVSGNEQISTSDDYVLASSMYQSLRDLALPLEPESTVPTFQHRTARIRSLSFAHGLLLATITRFTIVGIFIDIFLFLMAMLLPAEYIHNFLDYIGTPTPPFLETAVSLRRYQRFQFFKHTLLNLVLEGTTQHQPGFRFSHDGIVLRFARPGGGGHQFLNSVVEYFARDIGADLVLLSNDILQNLGLHWHREWTGKSKKIIGSQKSVSTQICPYSQDMNAKSSFVGVPRKCRLLEMSTGFLLQCLDNRATGQKVTARV